MDASFLRGRGFNARNDQTPGVNARGVGPQVGLHPGRPSPQVGLHCPRWGWGDNTRTYCLMDMDVDREGHGLGHGHGHGHGHRS